jgi:hypothetical protein
MPISVVRRERIGSGTTFVAPLIRANAPFAPRGAPSMSLLRPWTSNGRSRNSIGFGQGVTESSSSRDRLGVIG